MTLKFQWYIQKVLALMHRPQTLKLLLELVKKYLVPCSKHFLISLWLHVCSFSFAFAHNFHNIDMSKPLLKENKMMVSFLIFPTAPLTFIYNMYHMLPRWLQSKLNSDLCNGSMFPSMMLLLFQVKWWP